MRAAAGEVATVVGEYALRRADSRKLDLVLTLRDWLIAEARPAST